MDFPDGAAPPSLCQRYRRLSLRVPSQPSGGAVADSPPGLAEQPKHLSSLSPAGRLRPAPVPARHGRKRELSLPGEAGRAGGEIRR